MNWPMIIACVLCVILGVLIGKIVDTIQDIWFWHGDEIRRKFRRKK